MEGDVAGAASHFKGARLVARCRIGAHFRAAFEALGRHARGDFLVDHIDDAADGTAAVGQRGRAAQDFNLLRQHRFGRDGMVGADGRGILHFGAIGQDLHARTIHAADDGAAGAGAEMAGGDAGLAGQGFAQGRFAGAHQFLAFQYAHGRAHVVAAQGQGAGRDGNGRQGGCLLRQGAGGRGKGQHDGQGEGSRLLRAYGHGQEFLIRYRCWRGWGRPLPDGLAARR